MNCNSNRDRSSGIPSSLEQRSLASVAPAQNQVDAVSSRQGDAQSASNCGEQSVTTHQSQVQQVGLAQGHVAPLEKRLKRKRDPSPPLPNKPVRGRQGLILDKEDEKESDESDDVTGDPPMDLEEDDDLHSPYGPCESDDSSRGDDTDDDDEEDNDHPDLLEKMKSTFEGISGSYQKYRWEMRKGNIALARYQKYVDDGRIPQDLNFKIKMANPYPLWFKQYCSSGTLDDLKAAEDAILSQAKHAIVQMRHQKMKEFLSLHQSQCEQRFSRDNILNELRQHCGPSKFPRKTVKTIDDAIRETKDTMDGLFKELDERYQERLAKRAAPKPPKPTPEEMEAESPTLSSPSSPPPPPPPEPKFDWPSLDLTADEKIEFLFTNGQKQFLSIKKKLEKLDELDVIKQHLADIQKNLPAPREFGRSQPVRPNHKDRQEGKRNPPSKQHSNDRQPGNKYNTPRSYSEAARQAAPERQPSRQSNTSHRTVYTQHRPDNNNYQRQPQRQSFRSRDRGPRVPPSNPPSVPPAVAPSSRNRPPTRRPPAQQTDWQEVRYKKNNRKPQTQKHPLTLDRKSRVDLQRARK